MKKRDILKHPWRVFTCGSNLLGGLFIMLLVGCVCTPVSAQSYTKVISVKFERDSLLHVLQKINQLSGNCVNFRDEEVRKETKLITLEKKDVTVL